MATKRKYALDDEDDNVQDMHVSNKKHTLDSDEEDSDDYEKDSMHGSDVEGEEAGESQIQDEVKITPFNMREELQEGHFDKDGHYHWNKDAEIKDNWLDNIDWMKVKNDKSYLDPNKRDNEDSNDSANDMQTPSVYNESMAYRKLLEYMQPGESIQKTLQRLGKSRVKLTSVERLRRKKAGIVDEAAEQIAKFTELTNDILTRSGNMDIYQETYEQIKAKLYKSGGASTSKAATEAFDMYADDFVEKEKQHLESAKTDEDTTTDAAATPAELRWEFKWKLDEDKINGPYTTEQMFKWSQEKYFKEGVYVRKVGEQNTNFYTSNRIDFDLYL